MIQWKHIRKYLKTPIEGHRNCEQVLGSSGAVNALAQFWVQNSENFTVATASRLHEYVNKGMFAPKELVAYKKALYDVGSFLEECHKERELKRLEKEMK
tara:strand:- start:6203 stop:6499 length:297 start_codon:yes stop_codon:yes gene_type:complete